MREMEKGCYGKEGEEGSGRFEANVSAFEKLHEKEVEEEE